MVFREKINIGELAKKKTRPSFGGVRTHGKKCNVHQNRPHWEVKIRDGFHWEVFISSPALFLFSSLLFSYVFRRVGFSLKASQYDQVNWFHFTVLHIFARLGVFLSEIRLLNYEDRSGNRYSVDLYLFVPLFTSRIVFPQLGESHQ